MTSKELQQNVSNKFPDLKFEIVHSGKYIHRLDINFDQCEIGLSVCLEMCGTRPETIISSSSLRFKTFEMYDPIRYVLDYIETLLKLDKIST